MIARAPQSTGWMRWVARPSSVAAALFVALLALLQTGVLPFFPVFGARPSLVLVSVVVFASMHVGPRALAWGFGGGLLLDLFSTAPLGTNALLFTVIAYATGRIGLGLDRTHLVFPILATALATIVYYPALILMLQIQGFQIDWITQVAIRLLPAAALNVAAAIVLFPFVRQFHRWTRPMPGPRFKGVGR